MKTKVKEYLNQADKYLADADQQLVKKDLRQASEKLWGATSQAVKALATLKGWRHDGHARLFEAADKISRELKDKQLLNLFLIANTLHTNFYEGWLTEAQVLHGSKAAKKFIRKIKSYINEQEQEKSEA